MKKGRFTEEQIIGVLKQHEAGRKDLARDIGVSEATIYTRKSKYGRLEVSEARRLKALQDENRQLKSLVGRPEPGQRGAESGDQGNPMQNGHVESFNGRLRAECLNASWFHNLADARSKIRAWREEYNGERPHNSFGGRTPNEFAVLNSQL